MKKIHEKSTAKLFLLGFNNHLSICRNWQPPIFCHKFKFEVAQITQHHEDQRGLAL